MAWKVLVTSSYFDTLCCDAVEMLQDAGCVLEINHKKEAFYTFEELSKTIGDTDAVIMGLDEWNEDVFKVAPKLKAIAKFGVGVDNVDLQKAKEYGIKVVNARGGNANAVAEICIGMILGCMRGIPGCDAANKMGDWKRYTGEEMLGKTVGLIGFGDIARRVAKKLSGFDVRVIATDPWANLEEAEKLGVSIVSVDEVLSESNIVSIHIPLTKENHHFMNREAFAKMKKGAYFINTARGGLVDTEALLDALDSGALCAAAVDVYEEEPLPADARILHTPNIITLPHCGAETVETYHNIGLITASEILAVLRGEEPKNWMNR